MLLLYIIDMGCDYYILKLLHIYYSDTEYFEIILNRERGYFDCDADVFDEDEDAFEEKFNAYRQCVLTPRIDPIIIYVNRRFNKRLTEDKYKSIVEDVLHEYNKHWSDVKKIIKVEKRYER